MNLNSKICVIGLGYIGLPTASLLATKGFDVLGVDVQEEVVNKINAGLVHIVEPGLDILVKSAVHSSKLKASLQPEKSDVFILAVPTPFDHQHQPDLSYVKAASIAIASYLKEGDLVILESTSPVGTTEKVRDYILAERPELKNVYFAHCPERVIPGKVLHELVENDRIVGGLDEDATAKAVAFYRLFVAGEVVATDARTAEMCKLTENAFRDVNIAFANELSIICEAMDINVWDLIRFANKHPRVDILQPGPGVGGHCIAVDPWFIISAIPEKAQLLKTARMVNDSKPEWVMAKVNEKAKRFVNPVVACLGVTFKADIDDLRESPALNIAKNLKNKNNLELLVCDPNIQSLQGFDLVSIEEALEKADIIVILVDHKEFKAIRREKFTDKCVIDTKGILQ